MSEADTKQYSYMMAEIAAKIYSKDLQEKHINLL